MIQVKTRRYKSLAAIVTTCVLPFQNGVETPPAPELARSNTNSILAPQTRGKNTEETCSKIGGARIHPQTRWAESWASFIREQSNQAGECSIHQFWNVYIRV
mmetsp:Transcript_1143/g.2486  ORF Transcript_1143/g.2486 Transcript_1143/m.2486 type:complete len:102 (-) Transcript_1143:346-651(-)